MGAAQHQLPTTLPPTRLRERPLVRLLDALWRERWLGVSVAAGTAILTGLLVGTTMPRAPATAGQALVLMLTGFVAGGIAGLAMRSRWAMVLAPVAHVAAFEVARLGTPGITVERIRFDSAYGLLAFILGRGLYGVIGLLPMLLGVAYGVALARRWSSQRQPPSSRLRHSAGRALGALATAGLIALAVLIAWPASTPPVRGTDGQPIAGSIATLERVRLGEHDQWIMIHAASADAPVLLYLSGGPGQSDLMFSRVFFEDLARDFVVVGWDQRGTGKSYAALDPAETLTLDQAVADTVELTNYLRARFDEQKIYLLGESWGSTLGVLAVQWHPELYHAFIGSGQMVSQRETDRRLYHDMLAYAERTGNVEMARTMRRYGEPPYADPLVYAYVMGYYEQLSPYTPPAAYLERGSAAGLVPWGMRGSEYSLIEKANVLRGLMDMFSVMYPQLQEIDFRRDVTRLDVPTYMLMGEHELEARSDLAHEWFAHLEAPHKQEFTFPDAGHSVVFEKFQAFHRIMTDIVVPETYQGG